MNEKLQSSITNVFQKSDKRIVFWYDEKKSLSMISTNLNFPGLSNVKLRTMN